MASTQPCFILYRGAGYCLGDDLPYDVYAQLVQTPEAYAEAFKKAVLPAFQAADEDVFLLKQAM